ERSPRAAAPKPPASGVVLRRKKADTLGPDGQPLGEHFEPPPPPPPPVVEVRAEPPAPAPEIRPEPARPPEPAVAPPPAAAPPPQAVAPAPEPEQKPEPAVAAAPVFAPPPPAAPARPEPVKPAHQGHGPMVPAGVPGPGRRRVPAPSRRRGPRAGRGVRRPGPRARVHRRHQGQAEGQEGPARGEGGEPLQAGSDRAGQAAGLRAGPRPQEALDE